MLTLMLMPSNHLLFQLSLMYSSVLASHFLSQMIASDICRPVYHRSPISIFSKLHWAVCYLRHFLQRKRHVSWKKYCALHNKMKKRKLYSFCTLFTWFEACREALRCWGKSHPWEKMKQLQILYTSRGKLLKCSCLVAQNVVGQKSLSTLSRQS